MAAGKGELGQSQLVEIGNIPEEWCPGELQERVSSVSALNCGLSFLPSFFHHMKEFRKTRRNPQGRLYNTVKYFQPNLEFKKIFNICTEKYQALLAERDRIHSNYFKSKEAFIVRLPGRFT